MVVEVGGDGRAAEALAFGPGGGEAGDDAFADDVFFEFGDGADDLEDELTGRGRGVEVVVVRDEVDPQGPELVQGVDEILERTAQAVELPDQESRELFLAGGREHGLKGRALGVPAGRRLVDELFADGPAGAGDVGAELTELHIDLLFVRGHPGVDGDGFWDCGHKIGRGKNPLENG